MKKVIAILLVLSLSFSLTLITQANVLVVDDLFENDAFIAMVEAQLIDQFGEKFVRNQESAVATVDEIYASFPMNRAGEHMYPDFFGGMYIDENGNLVVQIVSGSRSSEVVSMSDLNDDVTEYVKFSRRELLEIQDFIFEFAVANSDYLEIAKSIVSVGLDCWNNSVEVGMRIVNEDTIAQFRENITDSSAVTFRESQGGRRRFANVDEKTTSLNANDFAGISPMNVSTINSGTRLTIQGVPFSAGFRAIGAGNRQGIVTSGHVMAHFGIRPGQNVPGLGSLAGSADSNGRIDAAFIETNSNITLTNTLQSQPLVLSTNVVQTFTQGQTLSKIGAETGLTNGTVMNANFHEREFNLTQQVRTNIVADSGDSGGIVFSPITLLTAGILVGVEDPRPGPRAAMYFSRATNVLSDVLAVVNLRRF